MNLIFDFDGTLADSIDELVVAANEIITKTGKAPLTKKEIREFGVKGIIRRRKINKIQIAIGIFYYRKKLASKVDTLDTFPRLIDTLKTLSKKHTLGVLTSNSRENVIAFLEHHKLIDDFSMIESQFSLFGKHRKLNKMVKKYKLDRKDTLYIGDETRDIIAAKKARVSSVAVTWGFEGKNLLEDQRPYRLVHKPTTLESLLLRT